MKTTLGQLLINEALPEEFRDHNKQWDSKAVKDVLRQVAQKYPDKYVDVSHRLIQAGQIAVTNGHFSFGIKDFLPTENKHKIARKLEEVSQRILDQDDVSADKKKDMLVKAIAGQSKEIVANTLQEHVDNGSRLAEAVASGSKGKPDQFNATVGIPMLYTDHKDRVIPFPILNSLSEGFTPAEYWAASYGTRKGVTATKFSTRDSGYFGKKLVLAAHRLITTEHDCGTHNGIVVDGGDSENIGTVLQHPAAGIAAGTLLLPEHIKKLNGQKIVVRSPTTCQAHSGLCAKCSGVRETGQLPAIGDNIGTATSMVLGERLSQTALSTKHQVGIGSQKAYTFKDVERLFEMPKDDTETAAIAKTDGMVKSIKPAPAGGFFVHVNDQEHWIPTREDALVKEGDVVEAGDVLSKGVPNPAEMAVHRGIGDTRQEFIKGLRTVAAKATTRRNAEVIARAMVSHVQITDPDGVNGHLPGEIVKYDDLVRDYQPREGSKLTPLTHAYGRYLEQPALHYSIGTKVNNRVIKTFKEHGVNTVLTHEKTPGFEPHVSRMYEHSQLDPDWMTRLGGYHLEAGFLKGVHKGDISETNSTSYIPALAKGVGFGDKVETTGKY